MFEGRFTRCEVKGDMPMMGKFEGLGVYGYDNVAKQFQASWVDNMGTGMMTGTGELSKDGKTLTWTMHFNDPMTGKATVMREVDTYTADDALTMEMYGPGPDGKEAKMMEIKCTRKGKGDADDKSEGKHEAKGKDKSEHGETEHKDKKKN